MKLEDILLNNLVRDGKISNVEKGKIIDCMNSISSILADKDTQTKKEIEGIFSTYNF